MLNWYGIKKKSTDDRSSVLCRFLILTTRLRSQGLPECTYEIFYTNSQEPSAEHPILVLDNRAGELKHHSNGVFTNPVRRTAFEFSGAEGTVSADILRIDARFVSLFEMAGGEPY